VRAFRGQCAEALWMAGRVDPHVRAGVAAAKVMKPQRLRQRTMRCPTLLATLAAKSGGGGGQRPLEACTNYAAAKKTPPVIQRNELLARGELRWELKCSSQARWVRN
jgi:hypothetical protein